MDTGFNMMIFFYVLMSVIGVTIAVMIVLAPLKLWSIDKTLKEMLEELRKKK